MSRAVRFDRFGGREVLQVTEVPDPQARAGQVLVRVRAAAINPGEISIRSGALEAMYPTTFPCGEGSDFAGVVEAIGADVDAVAVGDEVLGWSDERSSHADLVVVPVGQVTAKPAGLAWPVAGSLFVAGTTALAAVSAVGAGADDTVAVSGAAGGVGTLVVQLLVKRGARVIGIASEANHEWLRSKGVVPVAYGEGLSARILDVVADGPDAFIDLYGPEYVELAIELGVAPERIDTIISFEAAAAHGTKAEGSAAAATVENLAELAEMAASGRLEVPIAATFPLDAVRDAYAELEQRHTRGKIVLIP